jgi:flagellar basal-body rod modification protein FlgD
MATTSTTNSTSNYYQSLMNSVNGTKASSTATSAAADTENRFLKLLTTQLKNQDPLNPMDNAQITSQIAQISTVSGIEKLNATLKTLLDDSQDSQTTLAASLLGQGVMVPGTAMTLTENGGVGAFELAGAADKVTVTIKDSNGLVVRTMSLGDLDSGLHDFAWDGKADDGSQAATGSYSISIAATKGADKVTTTALSLGTVRSVISNGTGYTLDVGSLGTFTLDDVRQIF